MAWTPRLVPAGRWLARGRYAWWIVGVAALLMLVGMTAIGAIEGLLKNLHGSGDVSAGLQSGLFRSPQDISAVVQGWSNFADADTTGHYWSAPALGTVSLVLDTLLVVPGYLVGGAIVLLQGAQWNRQPSATADQAARRASRLTWGEQAVTEAEQARRDAELFTRRLVLAYRALVALAIVDLLENLLSIGVLWGYWPSQRGTLVAPAGWAQALARPLWPVTAAKWLLATWVVVELVLLAIRYLNAHWQQATVTLRLLRAQLTIVLVLVIILQLPIQVSDAVLRLQLGSYLGVAGLTVGLATVQWSISRHLLERAANPQSRDLSATSDAPRWWWMGGFVISIALAAVVGAQLAWAGDDVGERLAEVRSGPGVLLGLLLVIAIGTRITRNRPQAQLVGDAAERPLGAPSLPQLLGAVVPVVVGLAILRHGVAPLAYRDNSSDWPRLTSGLVLVATSLVLALAFTRLDRWLGPREAAIDDWWQGWHLRIAAIGALAGFALGVGMVRFWLTWPDQVGAIGVVVLFLVGISALGGLVVVATEWASTRYKPPSLLRTLRFRRWPAFLLLLVWLVAASRLDPGTNWDVRRLDNTPAPAPRLTLAQAWEAWLGAQPAAAPTTSPMRPAIPLVMVAGSGGGIRAATWTALAMRCLFEGQPATQPDGTRTNCDQGDPAAPARTNTILLASGISGSSLGLAEFAAHLTTTNDTNSDWVGRLRGDYVSSELAWQLLLETPRSLLHFHAQDRAEIIERSWEQPWATVQAAAGGGNPMAQGLLATQLAPGRPGHQPLLLFNGDSVYDGCWLLSSALDEGLRTYPDPDNDQTRSLERPVDCHNLDPYTANRQTRNQPAVRFTAAGSLPGVVDAADFLCATDDGRALQDLRLSTAALLSARFPEVSPAGRLQFCDTRRTGSPPRYKFVLDGGVIEASASETALAAWDRLRPLIEAHNAAATTGPCVVPFFVQLDNGYLVSTNETTPRPPNQLLAPLQAQQAAGTGSRAERARQAAALAFSGSVIGDVQATGPDGNPLGQRYARLVPLGHPGPQASLGWALSTQTQRDLEAQLYGENKAAIATVRGWLTSKLTCSRGQP